MIRCCCLQKEDWKQTLCASIVRHTWQGKLSAWVGQRIEKKELAGGRRIGQNDLQHFMAKTMRSKKAPPCNAKDGNPERRKTPPCSAEDRDPEGNNLQLGTMERQHIYWAIRDLFNLDSTHSRNWLPTTRRKVQVWHNAIIHNNQITGCLAKEGSMPDQETNIRIHPTKLQKILNTLYICDDD